MISNASEQLIALARTRMFHSGGTFNAALDLVQKCNPDLVKAAAREAQGVVIANEDPKKGRKERMEAAAAINEAVHDRMRQHGETHAVAWRTVTTDTHRSLAVFANSGPQPAGSVGPAMDRQKEVLAQQEADGQKNADRVALGLPQDFTEDDFKVALRANGGNTSDPDYDAIWNALARFYAKKNNVNLDAAKAFCMGRFQILATKISPDSKPQFAMRSSEGKGTAPSAWGKS